MILTAVLAIKVIASRHWLYVWGWQPEFHYYSFLLKMHVVCL